MEDKWQMGMAFVLALVMMAFVMAGAAAAVMLILVVGFVIGIVAILVKFGDQEGGGVRR